jgi:oligoribonuclease
LGLMDNWNVKHHGESGLIDRVKASNITEEEAQAQTLKFLLKYVKPKTSPMCGNSIWQDRRFLARWMPKLEEFFHYRLLDVSTLKILSQLWAPEIYNGLQKESRHLAKHDIYDSIAELKYYREKLLR